MFHMADSLGHLADAIRVPASALANTVEKYNEFTNEDPFGRRHRPLRISKGPFYAITVHGISVTSTAGLAVDEELRVVRTDGSPIEGLYAMGELLGSGILQGQAFCGGMLATPALAFGLELGKKLAIPTSSRT